MDDEEKAKKAKKHLKKLEALMLEVSEDMIDDETMDLATEKITELLQEQALPMSLNNLKAVKVGYELGTVSLHSMGKEASMVILMTLQQLIQKKKNDKLDAVVEASVEEAIRGKK